MRNRAGATVAIILLLAVSILACVGSRPEPAPTTPSPIGTPVPSTPTPETSAPNYSNSTLGLSLWYPDIWLLEEMPDLVAFASSSTLMSGEDWETGAAFAIMVGEMESGQTVKELIQQLLEESAFDDVKTTELQPVSIGENRGVITNLEATPVGTSFQVKGFVAAVEHNRRAYMFMGISVKEDWAEYGGTLEAMLRSVRFSEPSGIFTSEDLGLKMWYPEDWVLEEEHDQVVFATSYDLIDSGNLQTGAALMVTGSSLGDVFLEDWFEEELEALTFDQGGLTSDVAPRVIASQQGLIIDLEGRPSGADSSVTGFVAGAAYDGWGYLFLAFTAEDEWTQYAPTLERMLDSVQFIP
ncbi:MAG TPA: hypothetical protein VMW58_07085 [Anaerolineae bacterium]|nr:hypothetical protein [Anaerolineae bacterium]